jgi:hypothetical protein
MNRQLSTLNSESFREQAAQPSVQLHIERLILEGLPASRAQGPAIGAAVEAELTRLLSVEGLATSAARAEPHLPAGHIHLIPDGGPRSIGQQIGGAVHHVLNQSKQTTTIQKANAP